MHKNLIIIILILFVLVNCKQNKEKNKWWQDDGKLKVMTTIAMIEDLVKEIGGEWVDTICLIRGELDPHSYELVKGDNEKFSRADLIFCNGLGLEHSLSLRNQLTNISKTVVVTDALLKNHPDLILYSDERMDPHVWMDMTLWAETVDPIAASLAQKDPEHASYFFSRAQTVKNQLLESDQKIYQSLQKIESKKRILITSHDAFHYFTRRYLADPGETEWQYRCAAPEGLAPDAQLSLNDIYHILSLIEKYHVSVLFPESNLSIDSLNKLVQAGKQKGCQVILSKKVLYGDSMGQSPNYIAMMEHNAEVICSELKGEQ